MACAAAGAACDARAGGFMLQEQSQLEIGRAFSGGAAAADDPSTIFYNPAGMTELPGIQIATGATALFIDSHQRDLGSTITRTTSVPLGPFPTFSSPIPISGGNGGNPFAPVVPVPTTYASAQIGQSRLWLGFGLSAPFGLKLRYAPDFVGRYNSTYSNMLTLNAQPSFAWRVNNSLSIGGGLDIQYADVTLEGAMPSAAAGGSDTKAKLSGDDIALGWNAGVLLKLDGGLRIGLHYRSQVKHDLKGKSELSGFSGALSGLNGSTPIRSPLTLPGSITASISFPLDSKTRFMATGRHYNWSVFDKLRVVFPDGTVSAKDYQYRDSWSLSAGLEHVRSDRLTLRAGAMFDRTPTNPAFLSTRVPDGDRSWLSTGLSYRLSPHLTLNASYAHVFIEKQTLVRTESFFGPVAVDYRLQSSGNVDMLATSVTARF
ncbi:long-chain fatty acid transporter [Sphingobium fluviale]|uniref:Long-chain fatty acid transporter n=2 Tax=Sphingobium fluviale TaxID=2506423 RepID=A0A4Q1KK83_9SPHN|nr:long-chain fatty acid transporter [Sphingobium fluviale]